MNSEALKNSLAQRAEQQTQLEKVLQDHQSQLAAYCRTMATTFQNGAANWQKEFAESAKNSLQSFSAELTKQAQEAAKLAETNRQEISFLLAREAQKKRQTWRRLWTAAAVAAVVLALSSVLLARWQTTAALRDWSSQEAAKLRKIQAELETTKAQLQDLDRLQQLTVETIPAQYGGGLAVQIPPGQPVIFPGQNGTQYVKIQPR